MRKVAPGFLASGSKVHELEYSLEKRVRFTLKPASAVANIDPMVKAYIEQHVSDNSAKVEVVAMPRDR